eukprot:gene7370-15354_t
MAWCTGDVLHNVLMPLSGAGRARCRRVASAWRDAADACSDLGARAGAVLSLATGTPVTFLEAEYGAHAIRDGWATRVRTDGLVISFDFRRQHIGTELDIAGSGEHDLS